MLLQKLRLQSTSCKLSNKKFDACDGKIIAKKQISHSEQRPRLVFSDAFFFHILSDNFLIKLTGGSDSGLQLVNESVGVENTADGSVFVLKDQRKEFTRLERR